MITKSYFCDYQNQKVHIYTLENEYLKVSVTDFGAIIQSLIIKSENAQVDVALGFDTIDGYIESDAYIGATIGRVANRIGGGAYTLNNKTYTLAKNDGLNTLHGGLIGFDKRFYRVKVLGDTLIMSLISPDGDQGFNGNLEFSVEFSLDKNSLLMRYFGTADQDTYFCPTNHTYFNLNGQGKGNIYDTYLKINAEYITPVDKNLITTGQLLVVENTPFDFRDYKLIGDAVNANHASIASVGGIDHNFCTKSCHLASGYSPNTKIKLDIYSDYPAVQFYTSNMLKDCFGKGSYGRHTAFCLEPQFYPNAVNIDGFKKPLIKKNEQAEHYIKYQFSKI